jgi:uncharacterized protein (DUF1800 family)
MLEAAIQKQLVRGDVRGAITDFETILARYGDQHRIAAQALWRLAQSQEQIGRISDARRNYQRLVQDHTENTALVSAASARLSALGGIDDRAAIDLGRDVVTLDWTVVDPNSGRSYTINQRNTVFSDLSVFDRNTGETRRLNTTARSATYPVVSPDGLRVAYLSWQGDLADTLARRQSNQTARTSAELRVVGINNSSSDRLVARADDIRWLRPFAWSPDGASILTLFERKNGLRQVAVVGVADGKTRVLKTLPYLTPQDMAFSPEGSIAAYQITQLSPTEFDFVLLPVTAAAGESRYSLELAEQRASVSPDDLSLHVLNRTGFGPRRGDIDRVKSMGVDAYIDQQLHPERLADPVVDEKIAGFTSLKMEIPELLEKSGPVVPIAERRRISIFERPAFMARTEAARKAGDISAISSEPRFEFAPDRPYDLEAHTARVVRAVHSEKQLQEVLVDFWMNHFNVDFDDDVLTPSFEEQAIRANVFGKFETMLRAVARHPKMLYYLDNWRSSAPADVIERRMAEQRKSASIDDQLALLERAPFLKDSKGLNENFARELLELHTMGVGSGYTQQDIVEVAKILSGWTIRTRGLVNGQDEDGIFGFDPMMHVDGDKTVLGQTFKSSGVQEGEQLLTMLAQRPETARFISTKLARRFIADEPPAAVIDQASRAFMRTGGDLREVVRAILLSAEFRSPQALKSKIKKPFELVVSSLRAVNASFEDLEAYVRLISQGQQRDYVTRMGERMYTYEAPDGNPDVGPAWMNSNALLVRLDFANALATNRIQGIKSDLAYAQALLTEMGVPRPTPQQIASARTMLEAAAAAAAEAAMGGNKMMTMGGGQTATAAPQIDPAALTVAAMLGSPQFQKR